MLLLSGSKTNAPWRGLAASFTSINQSCNRPSGPYAAMRREGKATSQSA